MLKEIIEGVLAASLILGLTVVSIFSEEEEESTEIIHVFTFVDKTFDEDETILVEGSYGEGI